MRQVNPPRSAIFDGFYGFKRSRTFWISKDHNLCVCKAFERHTCSPWSVPAGTGISPVPTGTLPGGPRGPPEAIQTRRLPGKQYRRVELRSAAHSPICEKARFRKRPAERNSWPFCRIWTNPGAQVIYTTLSTRLCCFHWTQGSTG